MTTPKNPAGITLALQVERDSGTTTTRYSTRPFNGTLPTEGRVMQFGPITRGLSDDQGSAQMSTASVVLNDDDGAIRGAIAENPTRFLKHSESILSLLSDAGRTAGLGDRILHRGRVTKVTPGVQRIGDQRARSVQLDLVDALAPYYDANLNKALFLRSDFPDIDRALEGTPLPLIGGEFSDAGAEDVNGNNAELGMVPLIYTGTRQTIDDDPTSGTPAFLAPPADPMASVNGTPASTSYWYGVTALSAVGETVLSAIVTVTTGAALLTATDSITLTWTDVPDNTGIIVYGRSNSTPVRRLATLAAGATTWTDDGTHVEHAPAPPEVNTAQVPLVDGGFFWDFYIVALGVVKIQALYGSDVPTGTGPRRGNITDTAGVDFLIPGFPGWPHANNYIELPSGLRVTAIYGRGPRSYQHVQGTLTLAVNVCGYEDVGDGSGTPINQAFPLLQHFLNEFVLKNGGAGYKTGNWGPLEAFADTTPMLNPVQFTACQTLTKSYLENTEGYTAAIYLRQPITVRDFLQTFYTTFDAFGGANHFGQYYPVLTNTLRTVTDGRVYRERIEIRRLEPPILDVQNVEPLIKFQYDYNPDQDALRSQIETKQDTDALANWTGITFDRGVKSLTYTRDPATARDAMSRRLFRLKNPRWQQAVVVPYTPGLADEPGDQLLITHSDGADTNGWSGRPFMLTSHMVDSRAGEVTLTAYDMQPVLQAIAPALGSETSGPVFTLGDETSPLAPPTGAYRLP